MAKWDAALYGEKLLKKSSLEQMWSPVKLNDGKTYPYGFGWGLRNVEGGKSVEHGGAWQDFKSYIARYLDEKTTVIMFANLAQANIETLAHKVAEIYNPKLAPLRAKAIEDKEPKVTEFAKNALQKWVDGTIGKDLFGAEAQETLYPKVTAAFESLRPLGKVAKLELLEKNGNRRCPSIQISGDICGRLHAQLFSRSGQTGENKGDRFKARIALLIPFTIKNCALAIY